MGNQNKKAKKEAAVAGAKQKKKQATPPKKAAAPASPAKVATKPQTKNEPMPAKKKWKPPTSAEIVESKSSVKVEEPQEPDPFEEPVAKSPPKPEKSELEVLFEKYDSDKNGSLSQTEAKGVLTDMSVSLTDKQFEALWSQVDTDKNGRITLSELKTFAEKVSDPATLKALAEAAEAESKAPEEPVKEAEPVAVKKAEPVVVKKAEPVAVKKEEPAKKVEPTKAVEKPAKAQAPSGDFDVQTFCGHGTASGARADGIMEVDLSEMGPGAKGFFGKESVRDLRSNRVQIWNLPRKYDKEALHNQLGLNSSDVLFTDIRRGFFIIRLETFEDAKDFCEKYNNTIFGNTVVGATMEVARTPKFSGDWVPVGFPSNQKALFMEMGMNDQVAEKMSKVKKDLVIKHEGEVFTTNDTTYKVGGYSELLGNLMRWDKHYIDLISEGLPPNDGEKKAHIRTTRSIVLGRLIVVLENLETGTKSISTYRRPPRQGGRKKRGGKPKGKGAKKKGKQQKVDAESKPKAEKAKKKRSRPRRKRNRGGKKKQGEQQTASTDV